jgi:serine/threonine protein kinase
MPLGPYEIVAPIARVAWAEVYKARDMRLDRIVAIKVSKKGSKREVQRTVRARGTGGGGMKPPNVCRAGPDPHLNQWVDLGLSGSVKSNAMVAQHDPASETN